jgi:hypothetical protein
MTKIKIISIILLVCILVPSVVADPTQVTMTLDAYQDDNLIYTSAIIDSIGYCVHLDASKLEKDANPSETVSFCPNHADFPKIDKRTGKYIMKFPIYEMDNATQIEVFVNVMCTKGWWPWRSRELHTYVFIFDINPTIKYHNYDVDIMFKNEWVSGGYDNTFVSVNDNPLFIDGGEDSPKTATSYNSL